MKTLKFFLTLSFILLVFSSIGFTQKKPDNIKVYVTVSDLPLYSVTSATLTISGNGVFTPVVSTIYLNPLETSDFTVIINTNSYDGVLTATVNFTQLGCFKQGAKSRIGVVELGHNYSLAIDEYTTLSCN